MRARYGRSSHERRRASGPARRRDDFRAGRQVRVASGRAPGSARRRRHRGPGVPRGRGLSRDPPGRRGARRRADAEGTGALRDSGRRAPGADGAGRRGGLRELRDDCAALGRRSGGPAVRHGAHGGRVAPPPPDGARHGAALAHGGPHHRPARRGPAAAGDRRRATAPSDPARLPGGERSGEVRGAPRRALGVRAGERRRASPEPRPHGADAGRIRRRRSGPTARRSRWFRDGG